MPPRRLVTIEECEKVVEYRDHPWERLKPGSSNRKRVILKLALSCGHKYQTLARYCRHELGGKMFCPWCDSGEEPQTT